MHYRNLSEKDSYLCEEDYDMSIKDQDLSEEDSNKSIKDSKLCLISLKRIVICLLSTIK